MISISYEEPQMWLCYWQMQEIHVALHTWVFLHLVKLLELCRDLVQQDTTHLLMRLLTCMVATTTEKSHFQIHFPQQLMAIWWGHQSTVPYGQLWRKGLFKYLTLLHRCTWYSREEGGGEGSPKCHQKSNKRGIGQNVTWHFFILWFFKLR